MMAGMGFDEAEIDYANKRLKANEMKIRLADKQVSEQDAAEADAAAREACLHFKFLCRARRDALLPTLGPTSDLTPASREARQHQCDELATRLVELEAAYPGELEYKPPAQITAKRTML
jgi:hypothetical protein